MNEMDKKMEEFFQKSMGDFNDAPADTVWDQLSDQLDREETMAQRVWKKLRSVLPIALLLLSFGALSIYSYVTISNLKKTNNLLQSENIGLNESNATLNKNNKTLENKNESLITEITTQKEEFVDIQQKVKENQVVVKKSAGNNDHLVERLQLAEALNLSYESQLNACANDVSEINKSLALIQNEVAALKKENERLALIEQKDHVLGGNLAGTDKDESTQKAESEGVKAEKEDRSGLGLKVEDLLQHEKLENLLSTVLEEKKELEEKLHDVTEVLNGKLISPAAKSLQYRYGVTGRAYNTFVPDGTNFNLSTSYGVRHELTFKQKWSLTHSIEFNEQEYLIKMDSGALPRSVLDKYPDSPGAYADVRSVKSRAKYFDTQLGIKYQWPSKSGKLSYFVNPAVVWQLYLPQEFNYDLIQAQDLLVERREYVAYLGSINLQLGIERSLNQNIDFQLALFVEESMIDLGFDNQDLTLVGLRSSVLFGK